MVDAPRDPVEAQASAYNDHDLDAFVACYSRDVVIENGSGEITVRGADQLRERYATLFESAPTVKAEIIARIRVGPYIIDEEKVTGHPAGDLHAAAIFRLGPDDLIEHVRFLF